MCRAHVAVEQDRVIVRRVVGIDVGGAAGQAAERIAGDGPAGRGAAGVEVVADDQQMAASRTSVAGGEKYVPGQLAFDIHVILMNPARLEVPGLVNERSWVRGHILRSGKKR